MKQKVFKIQVEGSENHVVIFKCPANAEDVLSALHFVDETSELRVTLVSVQQNENGDYIEV